MAIGSEVLSLERGTIASTVRLALLVRRADFDGHSTSTGARRCAIGEDVETEEVVFYRFGYGFERGAHRGKRCGL